MSALSVVRNLRDTPSLADIASQLRQLANKIESGEQPAETVYAGVLEPDVFLPTFYGWGCVQDRHGIAGVFTHLARLALTDAD